ncbi:hypothetical protein Prudu_150S000400 [Prunus dulcis]|uniref:Retrotransposon gag domain-containing protein n=1 Tax=Prunus dulcis TaxID=3755 RepID=A0A5H2XMN5_PRUDU|nr:hypothetical protein Prudu_150S000400 [Prunus dulcis]
MVALEVYGIHHRASHRFRAVKWKTLDLIKLQGDSAEFSAEVQRKFNSNYGRKDKMVNCVRQLPDVGHPKIGQPLDWITFLNRRLQEKPRGLFSLSPLSLSRDAAGSSLPAAAVATSGRLDLRRGHHHLRLGLPIFLHQSPAGGRSESIGNCRNPTEVARTSLLSISSVSQSNQSSEAPGVRLISRRDPREVQLARTSLRRTKETARAISLAPAPPPSVVLRLFDRWKTLGMVKYRGDSAEFSAEVGRNLIKKRLIMAPKRGGFRRGTRQSSRVRGQNPPPELENFPTPEPVQEPVEQSFVGGPSGPAPPMPTVMGDPNLQQTLELLTQALSRAGQSRDPSLGYADQAKRIGATEFDGDGDPAVMAVPQDRRVTLATFFLTRNARFWWESVRRRYRDPAAITWPVFRAAFDSQYYPQAYQNMKMEEFLQLEQGSMTVLEYEKKFNELSKYCLPLVEDESKKCQLFTRGSKASIRNIVISQRLTNFGDLPEVNLGGDNTRRVVPVRGHPREVVIALDHLAVAVSEVFDQESVPVEAQTRVVVLETDLRAFQLGILVVKRLLHHLEKQAHRAEHSLGEPRPVAEPKPVLQVEVAVSSRDGVDVPELPAGCTICLSSKRKNL